MYRYLKRRVGIAAVAALLLLVGVFAVTAQGSRRVDCSNFVATSPLNGMNWGHQQFYWDAAPGAAAYRLDVFDNNLTLVVRSETTDLNMFVFTGADNPTGGVNYTWYIVALDANGNEVCSTPAVISPRGAAPSDYLSRDFAATFQATALPPQSNCVVDESQCLEGVKSVNPFTCAVTCFTCEEVLGFPGC